MSRGLPGQLDFFATSPSGWPGALEGLTRAKDHAEAEQSGWGDRARQALERYLARVRPATLIAPNVRVWAEAEGLDKPPNNYAWGAVFLKASRDGLLIACGFETYGDAVMHSQSVRVWRPAAEIKRPGLGDLAGRALSYARNEAARSLDIAD